MKGTNIYLIGSVEQMAVKIGKSDNPVKRLNELQTGNPHKLFLYGVIENVNVELENKLHRIMKPLQMEGEWFKLTDKLIQFMVSKTDHISYDYKVTHKTKSEDPLDLAIDKIVKPTKRQRFMNEDHLFRILRKYLSLNDENPHFDIKKLRRKLKDREIYNIRRNGEWVYLDYVVDEKPIQPDHYLGPIYLLDEYTVNTWEKYASIQRSADSREHMGITINKGYSEVSKDDPLTVTTEIINNSRLGVPVVIYKKGIYDASCVHENFGLSN